MVVDDSGSRSLDQYIQMRRITSTFIVSAAALLVVATTWAVSAQNHRETGTDPTIYFPYPSGLIPSDLQSEIERVNREVDQIFQETLARSRALPAPHLAGNPQIIQEDGTLNRNQACSFCHMPYTGFTGPISSVNATVVSYPGSVHFRFSGRKPMGYTYSPYYPPLHYNDTQQDFYGGNFWDLRATGYKLQSPDGDQAQHPIVDTQEQGFPDTACVVLRLSERVPTAFRDSMGQAIVRYSMAGRCREDLQYAGGSTNIWGESHSDGALSGRPRPRQRHRCQGWPLFSDHRQARP